MPVRSYHAVQDAVAVEFDEVLDIRGDFLHALRAGILGHPGTPEINQDASITATPVVEGEQKAIAEPDIVGANCDFYRFHHAVSFLEANTGRLVARSRCSWLNRFTAPASK